LKVVIYTTITGGYDLLTPHADTPGAEFVCLTDRPRTPQFQGRGWDLRRIPNLDKKWSPRMVAKWAKMFPHRIFPDADLTIFVDGNKQIVADLTPLIEEMGDASFGLYPHPHCLRSGHPKTLEEEVVGLMNGKCRHAPEVVEGQLEIYKKTVSECGGWPVYAGFVLFRRRGDDELDWRMIAWWDHVQIFSRRDQVALAYIMGLSDEPHAFDVSTFGDYFVRYIHGTAQVDQYIGCANTVPKELQPPWEEPTPQWTIPDPPTYTRCVERPHTSNFVCVDVGYLYGPKYVHALWRGLQRHAKNPRLTVFTDHVHEYPHLKTVDVTAFMGKGVPKNSVAGRWGRMMIFCPELPHIGVEEPFVYIDVDNIVLRDPQEIVNSCYRAEFSAHHPWRQSAKTNDLAASVMGVTPGSETSAAIWDYYWRHRHDYKEFLTQNLYQYALEEAGLYGRVNWISRKQVASYKWMVGINKPTPQWLGTLEEAIVLCFHGKPDPPDVIARRMPLWETVKEEWV